MLPTDSRIGPWSRSALSSAAGPDPQPVSRARKPTTRRARNDTGTRIMERGLLNQLTMMGGSWKHLHADMSNVGQGRSHLITSVNQYGPLVSCASTFGVKARPAPILSAAASPPTTILRISL